MYIKNIVALALCAISSTISAVTLSVNNEHNKYPMWVHFHSTAPGKSPDWMTFVKPGEILTETRHFCFDKIHGTVNVPNGTDPKTGQTIYRNGATFTYIVPAYWHCTDQKISFWSTNPIQVEEYRDPGQVGMAYYYSGPKGQENVSTRLKRSDAENNNIHREF